MKHLFTLKPEEKKKARTFGWGLAGLFALFTLIHIVFNGEGGFPWQLYVCLGIAVVNLLIPVLLAPIYRLAMIIAQGLGWFNTRLLLGLIFFLLFTPLALIFRLMRRDFLDRKLERKAESYWQKRPPEKFDPTSVEKQF